MTNLVATPGMDAVPQVEISMALLGGPGGPLNGQAQALLNRTAALKLRTDEVVSVKQFGATGDGVADDTAEIQSALSSGAGAVFFPPGVYLISTPLVVPGAVVVVGAGPVATRVIVATDIDVFRVDIGTGYKYFNTFREMSIEYTGVSAPSTGSAIRYYDSTGLQLYGGTHGTFRDLIIKNNKYGITFDRAKLGTFSPGWSDVADYGQFLFDNIRIPYNNDFTDIGIWFKGGPGAHNTFTKCSMQVQDACVRMGGSDDGVGDQLFVGNHFMDADYGVDIVGPTTGGHYNQNVTIVGNQADGIATATFRMTRMTNFRIGPNNSTSAVGVSLVSCTAPYETEDRTTVTHAQTHNFTGAESHTGAVTYNTTASPEITDAGGGWKFGMSVFARRLINTAYMKLVGGTSEFVGAGLTLYGGAHATNPNEAYLDGDRVALRTQAQASMLAAVTTAGTATKLKCYVPIEFKSYAKASLPSAAEANWQIMVTDDVGGMVPAFSDGTNWRRVTDRNIIS